MIITKQVIFIAKDENIDKLKELLVDMIEPSRDEDGCLFYHIHQMVDKPSTFVVLESWRDDKALDGHKNSSHYAYYKAN